MVEARLLSPGPVHQTWVGTTAGRLLVCTMYDKSKRPGYERIPAFYPYYSCCFVKKTPQGKTVEVRENNAPTV